MDKDIAIKVENLSKTFRIPHEKVSSLRGAFVGALKGKRTYEEFQALDDVSFEVKKGEFFGIIGRNGSGKSTLLKILAGIYPPDKGKVTIDGMISPFLELGIGFNPELSGRDNIYLNATVLGLTRKQIDQKFDDIVRFSELERFIDQKLKNYSSGMQVRLAFSVSIHANRDILLMDEVLAVGDSNFQAKCLAEFNKYRDSGRTVIIVTHDIAVVQRYCDRVMLLRNGKIVKVGKAEEVGDAYIYENMSDEEHRMSGEEKKKLEDAEKNLKKLKGKELAREQQRIAEEKKKLKEERKNKVAEIIDVTLLDTDGSKKNIFKKGDAITIAIKYKKNKPVNDFHVGVAIFDKSSLCVLGFNTVFEKNIIIDDNQSLLTMRNTYFKRGSYVVKAGLFYGDGAKQVYDFSHNAASFSYVNNSLNVGIVDGEYEWR